MAYEKQTWSDVHGETPIDANRLNHMEQGIEEAGKTGGIEVGTIVEWEDDVAIPEGYEEVETGYSTSEVKTGEYWIDGKPIYRKVIQVEIPPTDADGTMAEVYYTVSNNIDKIIDIRGFANVDNRYSISFPLWMTTTNYKLYVRANGDNLLHVLNYIKAFSGLSGMAIVEYTKTTD